jgi:hypothetical protein
MASEPTIAVLNVVSGAQPIRAVRFLATANDAAFRVNISSSAQDLNIAPNGFVLT